MDLRWLTSLAHLLPPDSPASGAVLGRRPPRHADESLTGTTRLWLRRLPGRLRPMNLCRRYPRVANHLAWHWRDERQAAEVLADLLEDRRGGRRGFPLAVAQELRRLQRFNDSGRADAAAAPTRPLR